MTGEFEIAVDHDTGQLTMTGPSAGPAGGAMLFPVPGLDLLFDRRNGRLCRLTIDLPDPGGGRPHREQDWQHMLPQLLGAASARAIQRALRAESEVVPEPATTSALSRLARFDAARAASPVPTTSPLWPAEAALLADQAALPERAQAEAARAAAGLAELSVRVPLPDVLAPAIVGVSRLIGADQPDLAKALREGVKWFDGSLSAWLAEFQPPARDPLEVQSPGRPAAVRRWALDLASVPAGLLVPGLNPEADMVAHLDGENVIVVEGRLAPGADPEALSRCRVRLVDPQQRQVIAQAPLTMDGAKATARLQVPGRPPDLSSAWFEVVAAHDAPVHGTTLRTIRQALRWADAAIRAERRPHGLAPSFSDDRWAGLASESWEHCRRCWESAGDHQRAGQIIEPDPPRWPGYLAETIGPLLSPREHNCAAPDST